ncbi:hypothetical protein [Nocardia brevicatena]|nr:hypothetical protein [Nocardia brevicatena]
MTLPQRPRLDEQIKGRMSLLPYVPHAVILTKVIDRLRALDNTPDPLEVA